MTMQPCPFCGGEAAINAETTLDSQQRYGDKILLAWGVCPRCHAQGPLIELSPYESSFATAEIKAQEAWNKRIP